MSSDWKAVCMSTMNSPDPIEAPCKVYFHESVSSLKIAWFISCMAKGIVERGFQIPVYLVHANNSQRYQHMKMQCKY